MSKQILRKELKREVVKDREHAEWHYIEMELLHQGDLNILEEHFDDDYEQAHFSGVNFGYESGIVFIEIDKLINHAEQYLKNNQEDKENDNYYIFFDALKDKLNEWKGFSIWV